MAHDLDLSVNDATSVNSAVAQANGAMYWKVIDDAVGANFTSFDRNRLAAIFTAAPQVNDSYCTSLTLLRRNLPEASQLQYSGSHSASQVSASAVDGIVHVTKADIGTLTTSRQGEAEGAEEGGQSYGGHSSYGGYSYGYSYSGVGAADEAEPCEGFVVSALPARPPPKDGTIKLVFK